MPRFAARVPTKGWQVAQRLIATDDGEEAVRWFLQRQRDDGSWEDVGGPNQQRGGAISRFVLLQSGTLTVEVDGQTGQILTRPDRPDRPSKPSGKP